MSVPGMSTPPLFTSASAFTFAILRSSALSVSFVAYWIYVCCLCFVQSVCVFCGLSAIYTLSTPSTSFITCSVYVCCLYLVYSICVFYSLSAVCALSALFASAMPVHALFALFTSTSISASTFVVYCKCQSSLFMLSKELINLALYLSWLHYPLHLPLYHLSLWPWQYLQSIKI